MGWPPSDATILFLVTRITTMVSLERTKKGKQERFLPGTALRGLNEVPGYPEQEACEWQEGVEVQLCGPVTSNPCVRTRGTWLLLPHSMCSSAFLTMTLLCPWLNWEELQLLPLVVMLSLVLVAASLFLLMTLQWDCSTCSLLHVPD